MSESLDDADLARKKFIDVIEGRVALRDDLDGDVRLIVVRVRQLHGRVRTTSERLHDPVAEFLQYLQHVVLAGSCRLG